MLGTGLVRWAFGTRPVFICTPTSSAGDAPAWPDLAADRLLGRSSAKMSWNWAGELAEGDGGGVVDWIGQTPAGYTSPDCLTWDGYGRYALIPSSAGVAKLYYRGKRVRIVLEGEEPTDFVTAPDRGLWGACLRDIGDACYLIYAETHAYISAAFPTALNACEFDRETAEVRGASVEIAGIVAEIENTGGFLFPIPIQWRGLLFNSTGTEAYSVGIWNDDSLPGIPGEYPDDVVVSGASIHIKINSLDDVDVTTSNPQTAPTRKQRTTEQGAISPTYTYGGGDPPTSGAGYERELREYDELLAVDFDADDSPVYVRVSSYIDRKKSFEFSLFDEVAPLSGPSFPLFLYEQSIRVALKYEYTGTGQSDLELVIRDTNCELRIVDGLGYYWTPSTELDDGWFALASYGGTGSMTWTLTGEASSLAHLDARYGVALLGTDYRELTRSIAFTPTQLAVDGTIQRCQYTMSPRTGTASNTATLYAFGRSHVVGETPTEAIYSTQLEARALPSGEYTGHLLWTPFRLFIYPGTVSLYPDLDTYLGPIALQVTAEPALTGEINLAEQEALYVDLMVNTRGGSYNTVSDWEEGHGGAPLADIPQITGGTGAVAVLPAALMLGSNSILNGYQDSSRITLTPAVYKNDLSVSADTAALIKKLRLSPDSDDADFSPVRIYQAEK